MLVRLGYVAISLLLPDCSTAKTITVKTLSSIKDPLGRMNKLRRVAHQNIENTLRVLRYNVEHGIRLYRFSSQTIPLATHPLTECWNYLEEFSDDLKNLGNYCRSQNLRVSSHPNHFTIINSPDKKVVTNSEKDLAYHASLFDTMGLDSGTKMVIHTGGAYGDKETSLQRFITNFPRLSQGIRERLVLENDDRSYSAKDVLNICTKLSIPMVLDVHHHMVLNNGENLPELLPAVYSTWKGQTPKLHFSSPKSPDKIRHHADNINPDDFYSFLMYAREINRDIDVMLEAKNKDIALFNLIKNLRKMNGITVVDGASLIL